MEIRSNYAELNERIVFQIPKIPKTRKPKTRGPVPDKKPRINGTSPGTRGRKRFVPLALKTCSLCTKEFSDHAGNLAHWKEVHPENEVVYKCQEIDRITHGPCNFTSKESEDIFKHRSKHKIREVASILDVKPEVNVE